MVNNNKNNNKRGGGVGMEGWGGGTKSNQNKLFSAIAIFTSLRIILCF